MALTGPGREHQHEARVLLRPHLVTLVRRREREAARTRLERIAVAVRDLHLAVGHEDPGPLVHLVLLELFAGGKVDENRAAFLVRVEHLRVVRVYLERSRVPCLHCCRLLFVSSSQPGARMAYESI